MKPKLKYCFIIFIFSSLLYVNTFNHDFAFDDRAMIVSCTQVNNGFKGIPALFTSNVQFDNLQITNRVYRPITYSGFAAQYALFNKKPGPMHMVSVLYYGLACCLVFLFLSKLFSKASLLLPLSISLLYAAHPIHTDVVCNIKSQDEILVVIFGMLCLYFTCKEAESQSIKNKLFIFLFLVLGVFSKLNALTIAGIIPLIFIYKNQEAKIKYIKYLPYLGFAFAALFLFKFSTFLLKPENAVRSDITLNNSVFVQEGLMDQYSIIFQVLLSNLALLVYPYKLLCFYGDNMDPISFFSLGFLGSLVINGGLLLYGLHFFLKPTKVKFGILFYFITFSIYSNIVKFAPDTFGDRFLFLPSLGYCIAIIALVVAVFKIDLDNFKDKKTLGFGVALLVYLSIFSYRTINRTPDWKNNQALFFSDVEKNPNSAKMHIFAAFEHQGKFNRSRSRNDADNTIKHVRKAVDLAPNNSEINMWYATILMDISPLEELIPYFEKGISLIRNPNDKLTSGLYFAERLFNKKYYQKAIPYYENYLNNIPSTNYLTYNRLAFCHQALSPPNHGKAIEFYQLGLQRIPNELTLKTNLGKSFALIGDHPNALKQLREAVQIAPNKELELLIKQIEGINLQ